MESIAPSTAVGVNVRTAGLKSRATRIVECHLPLWKRSRDCTREYWRLQVFLTRVSFDKCVWVRRARSFFLNVQTREKSSNKLKAEGRHLRERDSRAPIREFQQKKQKAKW